MDERLIEFYDSFTGKTYYLTEKEFKDLEEQLNDNIPISVDYTLSDLMEII